MNNDEEFLEEMIDRAYNSNQELFSLEETKRLDEISRRTREERDPWKTV